ncbi:MAG: CPBP family intramembrane metalloprotease [Planctomycetaceae bacterium]|nr:CPBP family intramembrane metalloprotease [Planctomycetaceae bacterium]
MPRSKGRRRIWTAFVVPLLGLVLALAFQAIIAGAAAAVLLSHGVDKSQLHPQITDWLTSPGGGLALFIGGQVGLVVPALFAAVRSSESWRTRLGLVPGRKLILVSLVVALASALPMTVGLGLAELAARTFPPDEGTLRFFGLLTPTSGFVFVVTTALLPGFFEEMLFRGYVQRRLLERWHPMWAIGVTTLMFSLVHGAPYQIVAVIPLGIWFGVVAWRTGTIVPTIISHAFVNGGLISWQLLAKFKAISDTTQSIANIFFFGIGILSFVLGCRMLARLQEPIVRQVARRSVAV